MKMTFSSTSNATQSGFRIINLEKLGEFVTSVTSHVLQCPKAALLSADEAPIQVLGEVFRDGLASFVAVKCNGCSHVIQLKPPKMPSSNKFEINIRAVWGQMVTGGGCASLNESLSTMGVPALAEKSFKDIEEIIGEWWAKVHGLFEIFY